MSNDAKHSVADQGLGMSALGSYISATATIHMYVQEGNWTCSRESKRLLRGGLGGGSRPTTRMLIVNLYLLHVLMCDLHRLTMKDMTNSGLRYGSGKLLF